MAFEVRAYSTKVDMQHRRGTKSSPGVVKSFEVILLQILDFVFQGKLLNQTWKVG